VSEWRQLLTYCANCDDWAGVLAHRGCARAPGAVLLDPEEFLLTCTACHEIWLVDDTEAICPACAHAQPIVFRDTSLRLAAGDRLLASDGTVVYVLLQSGEVVITHRGYIEEGA
jgi:hypothetical protein